MRKLSNIIAAAAVSMMLTGCGLYNKYEKTVQEPANIFGSNVLSGSAAEDATVADMSWREFFTDPLLQNLIEQALANNTDLNTARINIEKSEISLKTKKLAYLPSVYFKPQGSLYSFDGATPTKSYTIPLDVSWDIDVFGSIARPRTGNPHRDRQSMESFAGNDAGSLRQRTSLFNGCQPARVVVSRREVADCFHQAQHPLHRE